MFIIDIISYNLLRIITLQFIGKKLHRTWYWMVYFQSLQPFRSYITLYTACNVPFWRFINFSLLFIRASFFQRWHSSITKVEGLHSFKLSSSLGSNVSSRQLSSRLSTGAEVSYCFYFPFVMSLIAFQFFECTGITPL